MQTDTPAVAVPVERPVRPAVAVAHRSDEHLTLLGAPWHLNMLTGQDRADMLAFGRACMLAERERCLKVVGEWLPQDAEEVRAEVLRELREWEAAYMQQARGGDNSGRSDARADASREIHDHLRSLWDTRSRMAVDAALRA
jgi:hypothetical protein